MSRVAHTCHAYGCERHVPERMLMCAPHWRVVPHRLQRRVWATYVPGQERRKDPTREYLAAAHAAILAVADAERVHMPDATRRLFEEVAAG